MPWLRGGTVAVTNGSTTVVGTNADFAANSRIGDAFVGPDGINYEIGNVASATVISIIPAYKGPTASGVAYAIMPVQGYPKALADAFNNINLQWGPKLAALGTTGNYDVLPTSKGGTGISDLSAFIQTLLNDQDAAAGRGTLVAARSGANSDITSLAGLTTALSVTQGGTGVGTTAALLVALQAAGAYGKSNVVGTVSQSGGVPTGAIIETGTNAAGRYIKYADGKMECWGSPGFIDQTVANTAYSTTFGLPGTFVGIYAVFVNITSVNVSNVFSGYSRAASLTGATYSIIQCWSVVQTYTYSMYAIGRWF